VRISRLVLCCLLAVGAMSVLTSTSQADPAPTYYVALGDSLSQGYQPAHAGQPANGDTNQGYVDDVYSYLHAKDANLQLVKLGCSGETTTSMINGGVCAADPAGNSQLTQAVAFLTAHKSQVKYLTIDIGANDVDGCTPGGSIDTACLVKGTATIAKNLNTILCALKAADGGLPRSVGMTYYDPFLEFWLTGPQGIAVATASVGLLVGIDTAESTLYSAYGFHVADVYNAFQTSNFSIKRIGGNPVNVQTICDLTYMCSQQNIHANPTGYQVIATAFKAKLG
jgi:lysophospholipase L1-like esterase